MEVWYAMHWLPTMNNLWVLYECNMTIYMQAAFYSQYLEL